MKKVLLVDDERHIREDLGNELMEKGYAVYTAQKEEEARKIILIEEPDFAIIDLKLDYTSKFGGINIFQFAKRNRPKLKAIILSAWPFQTVEDDLKESFKDETESEKIKRDYISKGGELSYIRAVLKKLDELEKMQEKKTCFVIMPFSSTKSCKEVQWTYIFDSVIKPAVEESGFNYNCERANIPMGSIIEEILDKLNRSELVIADLTDRNPNVLYELGVRHALGGPVIIIAQNKKDIPFDLMPYVFKIYGWTTDQERDIFKEEIKKAIRWLHENPHKAVSPVRKYLNPIEK